MPKKISERQRLITYASQATEEQLSEAIETFLAIRAGRFPKERRKSATGKRSAKKVAATMPPALFEEDGESESVTATISKAARRKIGKFAPDPHMLTAIEENEHDRIEASGD